MSIPSSQDLHRFQIPDRVRVESGSGGLPRLILTTDSSEAEVYLHGAHVTRYQKRDDHPLLFMSRASQFASGQPIRGGVPVIFPWFGPREGQPAHGIARLHEWEWIDSAVRESGAVEVRLRFPKTAEELALPQFELEMLVRCGPSELTLECGVKNVDQERPFQFENCLHSYFAISSIEAILVRGLQGVRFLDAMAGKIEKTEPSAEIRIGEEVDRIYFDTPGPVDIVDRGWNRRIRVEKTGSQSTVLWNPWIAKAKRMPDFGDDEYVGMVCVESGNIGPNHLSLRPGESHVMRVVLATAPAGEPTPG